MKWFTTSCIHKEELQIICTKLSNRIHCITTDNILPSLIPHAPSPLRAALFPHLDHATEGLDTWLLVAYQCQLNHWTDIWPWRKEEDTLLFLAQNFKVWRNIYKIPLCRTENHFGWHDLGHWVQPLAKSDLNKLSSSLKQILHCCLKIL